MTARGVAFLPEVRPTAFTKLHLGDPLGAEGIFAPCPRVPSADSTGFGLPESLAQEFPGAGGRSSKAGAKSPLGWEDQSPTFAPFALLPGNVPDREDVARVVEFARAAALRLFELGYCKLTAFAKLGAAHAHCLSRLTQQTTLREVRGAAIRPWI
jgi:hypothetical protein